ncbi:MAG: hypothetical protein HYU73_07120 [Betaproteobacteria bacterium]|nr:hypothetical protein [Betaproteobacteria bacterium]MBI3053416.1 hypothetical protein [Betaproteobacteria bacterium]
MTDVAQCFLCDSKASVETVPGEGGNRFDVLCRGSCPQYEIAQGAIDYLPNHPIHRESAIDAIKRIAASGHFPVIKTVGVPKQLVCTSRDAEQRESA